jgi:HK97 family phage portal protein
MSERTALAISTTWTCVSILSEAIASLPCKLMRRTDSGHVEETTNPLFRLLAFSPNPEQTAFQFWSTMVGCSALTGNSYALVMRKDKSKNSPVESIWPLHPLKTEPLRQKDGSLVFKTSDGMQDGTYRLIDAADILHFPLFSMDGIRGVGPVSAAIDTFANARAMEKYSARFFANDATPPSLLIRKGDPPKDPKVQAEIRESWRAAHSGENQHTQGFLFGDWDVKTIGLNPEATSLIASRNYTRADIAAMFKIPPQMVGSLEKMTGSNYTSQQLSFVVEALMPIVTRIEQVLKLRLLNSPGSEDLFFKIDVRQRLRGDDESQLRTLALGRQWGILTSDECRIALGYNPIGDEAGKARIFPTNMGNMANIDELPLDSKDNKDDNQ